MKKIGIIADLHANLHAIDAVLEDMPEVDRIICAGDLVGYGPEPNEVLERINEEKKIISVKGNHDQAVLDKNTSSFDKESAETLKWTIEELKKKNLNFLKNLPEKLTVNEEGYEIFTAHGTPRKPLKEPLFPGTSNRALVRMTLGTEADLIILGHTHVPLDRRFQGKLIINPGAVGQPRDRNPDASYMVLELGTEKKITHKRVSYDIKETRQKMKDKGLPEKLAMRLQLGW